jgi:TatD DNase family protein
MELIDTHTHLDLDQFNDDLDEVLAASRAAGVTRWINVGFDRERWRTTPALAAREPGMRFMLGLHPGSTDEWSPETFDLLRRTATEAYPVAIGEIGLDRFWQQDNLDAQIASFTAQLDLAGELSLPAVIHMRDADDKLLEVIQRREALPHLHFHSFDGGDTLREWVVATDATIGVGGLATRRDSESLRRWIAVLPRDRVVLETDAPYLKPRGIRGMRNEPAYLVRTARMLAELWDTNIDDIARVTTSNAERIFGP